MKRPESDFALRRQDNLLLVATCNNVRKKIKVRVDQETLGDIIAVGGALEGFSRGENAKIRRRKNGQELTVRIRTAPGKKAIRRLPERERRFIGYKKTAGRRDYRASRRGLRHEIPFRDDAAIFILPPRRIEGRAQHAGIGLRAPLRRNFRAFDDDAQVLLAKHTPFGQTNFEGAKRTISGISEYVGDVKMDAARRGGGNENLRFAVGKLIARAEGVDAARRE